MDFSKLRPGEIVAGLGGVALIVFLFLDWFEGGAQLTAQLEIPDIEVPEAPGLEVAKANGWESLGFTAVVLLATGLGGIGLAGLVAAGRRVDVPVPRGTLTLVLADISFLLVIWKLFALDGEQAGAYLGLVAVIAISIGAYLSLRADGNDPLPAEGGVRAAARRTTKR